MVAVREMSLRDGFGSVVVDVGADGFRFMGWWLVYDGGL